MQDYQGSDLELKCVNTIRCVSADQPESAQSGHPGAPMGLAPVAYVLWTEIMKFTGKDPHWMNRDRFVLSNGHACALQYTMLHLCGYKLTKNDLQQFRQIGGLTPGHPERFQTEGPLGQGISNAVGLALAESHLAATYNTPEYKVFDNYTFVICGDGCLQEGISSEASSLAGHLGLGKLIVLYDDNNISIDGDTALSFTEDVPARYKAYGWHVQQVTDVETQLDDLRTAIQNAKENIDQPSMIAIKTKIGYGAPNKVGTPGVHGAALGAEELAACKEAMGFPPNEMFFIEEEVQHVFDKAVAKSEAHYEEWMSMYAKYKDEYPDKADEIERRFAKTLPAGIEGALVHFKIGVDKDKATRQLSQDCLNGIAPIMPELIGGSADLTPSNKTDYDGSLDYQKDTPHGRYIRFGVREHAMGAISNGMFAYGGMRPFCATFLTFTQYMMGSIRLAAFSKFGIIYVFTHDSIGLGEDGPTHQPVEQLEGLRSMPNINVYRPADANEMNAAYQVGLASLETPTAICCTRSSVEALYGSSVEKALRGAYVVVDVEEACALILLATGSEVAPCIKAAEQLTGSGIPTRVVSMPCQEVFLAQSEEYKKSVLPGDIPTLAVEAASPNGWHRFSHANVCLNTYGASGPGDKVFEYFGFTPANIGAKGQQLVTYYETHGPVPNLNNHPIFDLTPAGHRH
eukprot:scaffold101_cov123-Cylindrotheca_fusiformis.AAC.9